jgi:phosphohistidine swiveling domain-containing protein
MQLENFHSDEILIEPHVDRDVGENFDREAGVLSE